MASVTTRDHDQIQQWADEHRATPAVVSRTGGMLRFEFAPEGETPELNPVGWQDFFRVFDAKGLELVYDDKPGSRFHKLIYPESAAARASGRRTPPQPARSARRMKMKIEPIRRASPQAEAKAGAARKPTARAKAAATSKTRAQAMAKAKPRARKAA